MFFTGSPVSTLTLTGYGSRVVGTLSTLTTSRLLTVKGAGASLLVSQGATVGGVGLLLVDGGATWLFQAGTLSGSSSTAVMPDLTVGVAGTLIINSTVLDAVSLSKFSARRLIVDGTFSWSAGAIASLANSVFIVRAKGTMRLEASASATVPLLLSTTDGTAGTLAVSGLLDVRAPLANIALPFTMSSELRIDAGSSLTLSGATGGGSGLISLALPTARLLFTGSQWAWARATQLTGAGAVVVNVATYVTFGGVWNQTAGAATALQVLTGQLSFLPGATVVAAGLLVTADNRASTATATSIAFGAAVPANLPVVVLRGSAQITTATGSVVTVTGSLSLSETSSLAAQGAVNLLPVASASETVLSLLASGVSVSGGGALAINGNMEWLGGGISSTATHTAQTLHIASAATKSLTNARLVVAVAGAWDSLTGHGDLTLSTGASLAIPTGATFTVARGLHLLETVTAFPALLSVAGTLTFLGTGAASPSASVANNLYAGVQLQAGGLLVVAAVAQAFVFAGGLANLGGRVEVRTGGTLTFSAGTSPMSSGSYLYSAGLLVFTGTGAVSFAAGASYETVADTTLQGGVVTFASGSIIVRLGNNLLIQSSGKLVLQDQTLSVQSITLASGGQLLGSSLVGTAFANVSGSVNLVAGTTLSWLGVWVGSAAWTVTGGSHTVTNLTANGDVALSGGATLAGATADTYGTLTLRDCTLTGSLALRAFGPVVFAGSLAHTISGASLELRAPAGTPSTWSEGNIALANAAIFTVAAGAVLNVERTSGAMAAARSLTHSTGTVSTVTLGGVVNVKDTMTLTFSGTSVSVPVDGQLALASSSTTATVVLQGGAQVGGTITVSAVASTLKFDGGACTLLAGSTLTSAGTLLVAAGAVEVRGTFDTAGTLAFF
jgi:hypothetical protein